MACHGHQDAASNDPVVGARPAREAKRQPTGCKNTIPRQRSRAGRAPTDTCLGLYLMLLTIIRIWVVIAACTFVSAMRLPTSKSARPPRPGLRICGDSSASWASPRVAGPAKRWPQRFYARAAAPRPDLSRYATSQAPPDSRSKPVTKKPRNAGLFFYRSPLKAPATARLWSPH